MEDSGIDSDPKPPVITINPQKNSRMFLMNYSGANKNQQKQEDRTRRCTTKQLQRKLEARIEQAKRIQHNNTNYIKLGNNDCKTNTLSTKSTDLISIQRLSIPHNGKLAIQKEHYPLVEYWQSDSTESEDETTLFPISRDKQSRCGNHKQDLTDTFSIQESSEGSEDSLNLIGPTSHHYTHPHSRNCLSVGCFKCLCHIL